MNTYIHTCTLQLQYMAYMITHITTNLSAHHPPMTHEMHACWSLQHVCTINETPDAWVFDLELETCMIVIFYLQTQNFHTILWFSDILCTLDDWEYCKILDVVNKIMYEYQKIWHVINKILAHMLKYVIYLIRY